MERKNKFTVQNAMDNYKIERLILRTFIKYIKDKKLYILFRLSVNHGKKKNDVVHSFAKFRNSNDYRLKLDAMRNIGGEYASASCLDDILVIMHKQISPWGSTAIENTREFQMLVMNLVNSLLHSCIEYGVRDRMEILEELGSQIFEECCKTLLGDSFEDLTQNANNMHIEEILKKIPRGELPNIHEMLKTIEQYGDGMTTTSPIYDYDSRWI